MKAKSKTKLSLWTLTLLAIALSGFALSQTVFAHGTIDQQNISSSTFGVQVPGNQPQGQEFTPTGAALVGVDLDFEGIETICPTHASSTISVLIREESISGPVLGTTSLVLACPSPREWVHFDFPSPIALTCGEIFVLEFRSADRLHLVWGTQKNVYSGGRAILRGTTRSTIDWRFRTYSGTATNRPPCVRDAVASVPELWPPNHKMVDISIEGVTDGDGDDLSITITGIRQDEPVSGVDGTAPDATGVGSSTASVRAERDEDGDGRVYHIFFDADDGNGGLSSGEVTVTVPHDKGKQTGPAIDDGPLYDSTDG